MIRILFVCHGNICRSPMAEFILKDMVAKRGVADKFYIASAATSTEEIWNGIGSPIYPPAKEELTKHGIKYDKEKRAVQVTKKDYETYDYLICMDAQNLRNLPRIIGNDPKNKVSLLLDFTPRKGASIADPWYTGHFEVTYSDIIQGCNGFLDYLSETGEI